MSITWSSRSSSYVMPPSSSVTPGAGSKSSLIVGAFFFFQAEDGIRDDLVTGVQTCALPISHSLLKRFRDGTLLERITGKPRSGGASSFPAVRHVLVENAPVPRRLTLLALVQIGRASCRERV